MSRRATFLAAALVWAAAVPAWSQGEIRWKFREGQTLRFVQKTEVASAANIDGNAIETKLGQTITSTWKVKVVKEDGSAEMTQRVDRVEMAMDSPIGEMSFDSDKKDDAAEGPLAPMADMLKALVGQEVGMTMTPRGDVKGVKVPAKLSEAFEGGAALGGMFGGGGIKGMFEQPVTPLPERPLKVDESFTWKREAPMPLGTMTMETVLTFKGPDAKDPKLDRFETKSTMTIKPSPDAPLEMSIKDQDVRGELLFNREAGRLESSTTVQQLEMAVKIMDMEISQQVSSKSETIVKEAP